MVDSHKFLHKANERGASRKTPDSQEVFSSQEKPFTPHHQEAVEQLTGRVNNYEEQSPGWNPYKKEKPSQDYPSPTNPAAEIPQDQVAIVNPEVQIVEQTVSESPPSTSHHTKMSKGEKAQFLILRSLGNFLVLLSLYGVFATFGPTLASEVKFQVAQIRGIRYSVQMPADTPSVQAEEPLKPIEPGFGEILAGTKEQVLIPPDTQFSIVIPKIGATSKVFPNVDPTQEADFLPLLQQGVAHAKGTVFPGMEGNVYLFAHSTDNFWNVGRYNAIFYLIKELQPGDQIIVFFEGKRFNYVVDHTETKDPTEVDFLIKSQELGKQQLILQTCWPPGTTWKRLFVVAVPQT